MVAVMLSQYIDNRFYYVIVVSGWFSVRTGIPLGKKGAQFIALIRPRGKS